MPAEDASCDDRFRPPGEGLKVTSRAWPRSERPRERLLLAGPASLSDGELLAVLLGTGIRGQNAAELARRVLDEWGGLTRLFGAGAAELARTKGLGPSR